MSIPPELFLNTTFQWIHTHTCFAWCHVLWNVKTASVWSWHITGLWCNIASMSGGLLVCCDLVDITYWCCSRFWGYQKLSFSIQSPTELYKKLLWSCHCANVGHFLNCSWGQKCCLNIITRSCFWQVAFDSVIAENFQSSVSNRCSSTLSYSCQRYFSHVH